jgi:tRNA pseudouridine55 synthase
VPADKYILKQTSIDAEKPLPLPKVKTTMTSNIIYRNSVPVLVTLIAHLMIGIIFVLIKLQAANTHFNETVEVSFQPELAKPEEKKPESPAPTADETAKAIERLQRESGMAHNIGVNASRSFKDEISTKKYLDELHKQYNFDNKPSNSKEKTESSSLEKEGIVKASSPATTNKPIVYKGKTNIMYDLVNRHHTNLPVPVYRCEGSGHVIVLIEVDQVGRVVSAQLDRTHSDANECLCSEAISAARRSLFNPDVKSAPARQKGTIGYTFVAQ